MFQRRKAEGDDQDEQHRRCHKKAQQVHFTYTPTAKLSLPSKKQTLDDAYAVPANFLEIDVSSQNGELAQLC